MAARYAQMHMKLPRTLGHLFRAIGLEIINVLARTKRHPRLVEPPKPVISSSRRLGLARCAVHLLPAAVSAVLITLSVKQYYIGFHLQGIITDDDTNLALLQIAAKAQELLMTASISTIVFHMIRSELIYGDGVPLGWLGSGFSFTGLSYFWSPEFWYSLRYHAPRWKKLGLFGSLLVAGILAVIAGPASAVLLIPRFDEWSAGGSIFFLDGTADEIWPNRLSYDDPDDPLYCTGPSSISNGVCPSGGFQALWNHYQQVNVSSFLDVGTKLPYAGDLAGSRYYYETGPELQVPARITLGNVRRNNGALSTFLIQPHAATTIFQRQLTVDWFNAAQNVSNRLLENIARYHSHSNLNSRIKTQIPSVGVRCSAAQNISADSKEVEFPTQQPTGIGNQKATLPNINSTSVSHLRLAWAVLNDTIWPGVTTGAYLELPWSTNDSRVVIGCTIRASWLEGELWHAGPAYAIYTERVEFGTNREITVDRSWLDALTPPTPLRGPGYFDFEPSILESILIASGIDTPSPNSGTNNERMTATDIWNGEEFTGGGNRTTFLESILASHFVDGIARTGSHRAYNTTDSSSDVPLALFARGSDYNKTLLRGTNALEHPAPGAKYTELRQNVTIEGYMFRATSVADYLSMSVVAFHIAIALAHTSWCLWYKTSSGCWDTITELLVLAQNSPPAAGALQNTGAGIKSGPLYARKARLRATPSINGGGQDRVGAAAARVELRFDDSTENDEDTEMQPLRADKSAVERAIQTLQPSRPQSPHSFQDIGAVSSARSAVTMRESHGTYSSSVEVQRLEVDQVYG